MITQRKRLLWISLSATASIAIFVLWSLSLESFSDKFDAEYIGGAACGECHTQIYPEWQRSPHANMTRSPARNTVVGNFDDGTWMLPPDEWRSDGPDTLMPSGHSCLTGRMDNYRATRTGNLYQPQMPAYVAMDLCSRHPTWVHGQKTAGY